MASRVYEGMFLLDSNRYARDPNGVSKRIKDMIEKCDGEVLVSRLWNEQKLAYPVNGQRKGTYWLAYFRIAGDKLTQLNRESRLNDNVLRTLVIAIDDRLVDTLVQHVEAGSAAPSPSSVPSDGEGKASKDTEKGVDEATTAAST